MWWRFMSTDIGNIINYAAKIAFLLACSDIKYSQYRQILNGVIDALNLYGYDAMMMYILYEAGKGRIPAKTAKQIVSLLLQFKSKCQRGCRDIAMELLNLVNMAYTVFSRNKDVCKLDIDKLSLNEILKQLV